MHVCAHIVAQVQFNPTTYMVGEGDGKVTLTLECGPCAHNYTVGVVCSDGSAQGMYICVSP